MRRDAIIVPQQYHRVIGIRAYDSDGADVLLERQKIFYRSSEAHMDALAAFTAISWFALSRGPLYLTVNMEP